MILKEALSVDTVTYVHSNVELKGILSSPPISESFDYYIRAGKNIPHEIGIA